MVGANSPIFSVNEGTCSLLCPLLEHIIWAYIYSHLPATLQAYYPMLEDALDALFFLVMEAIKPIFIFSLLNHLKCLLCLFSFYFLLFYKRGSLSSRYTQLSRWWVEEPLQTFNSLRIQGILSFFFFGPTKISHHKLNCGAFLGSGMFDDNWREVVLGVRT